MKEKEFIKLVNKILYIKQSAITPFGGKKSELKGLKKLYKAICCAELVCERCESTKETEIICIDCLEELR